MEEIKQLILNNNKLLRENNEMLQYLISYIIKLESERNNEDVKDLVSNIVANIFANKYHDVYNLSQKRNQNNVFQQI